MKKVFSIILAILLLQTTVLFCGCGEKPKDSDKSNSETTEDFVYEISADGKYVYFGEYPQTIKANNVTIKSKTPDANGYYRGSDGARYYKHTVNIDFEFLGYSEEDWKAYHFAELSNGHMFSYGEELYFKVEKIRWRVLSKSNDTYFLMCDSVIENSGYEMNYEVDYDGFYKTDKNGLWLFEEDGETKIRLNNYKHSDVRSFLNNEFYNIAFSEKQKSKIQLTEVDNSAGTTIDPTEQYVCENTYDYVFPPSYVDMINPEYGFNPDPSAQDINRSLNPSDYAKALGVLTITAEFLDLENADEEVYNESIDYVDSCAYKLRSPFNYPTGMSVSDVYFGFIDAMEVYSFADGILPALYVTL